MEKQENKFGSKKPLWKFIWEKIHEVRAYLLTTLHELRAYLWTIRKKFTIHFRTSVSRYLALILSVLMIIRESSFLLGRLLGYGGSAPDGPQLELVPEKAMAFVIIPLSLLTLLALYWEFRGNKLSDTPQDRNFLKHMRGLLTFMETQVISDKEPGDIGERIKKFSESLMAWANDTLCGNKTIQSAMFLPNDVHTELKLEWAKPEDCFQMGLVLPISSEDSDQSKSPGVESFRRTRITYMPRKKEGEKKVQCSLLFDEPGFRWTEHVHGWIKPASPGHENFRSLLCVPVGPALDRRTSAQYGLLTFTTSHRDPFVTQDFQIATCFAKVLGQALFYARLKAEMNALQTANGNLQTQIASCLQEKQNLEGQVAEFQTQTDNDLKEKQQLQGELADLKIKIDSLKGN